jgi:hypothetical protein
MLSNRLTSVAPSASRMRLARSTVTPPVLVALVPRDLGLVDAKPLGEIALRHAHGDPHVDQGTTETAQVLHLCQLAALRPLVVLDFLG